MLSTSLMPRDSRLTAGLAAAVMLVAAQAGAQPAPAAEAAPPAPPETLETPYQDAAPAELPPPPPASSAPGLPAPPPPAGHIMKPLAEPVDTRPLVPIRAQRRLALTGEVGWNGLAGFGPVLSYYVHPHLAVDLGLGFSLMGWKAGLRGRFNLLTSSVTPFIGLGFNATSGLGQQTDVTNGDPNADPTRDPVTVDLKDSYLIQGVVGIDFMHRGGFTLLGCLGYSWLLNSDNYQVLAGELTADEKQGFDIAFKGGLVITTSLGYAFQ